MDYVISVEFSDDDVQRDSLFEAVADAVFDETQDANVSGGPAEDYPVGRLFGREQRADGTVMVSFRMLSGDVPGGADGIGRHYEIRWTGEES